MLYSSYFIKGEAKGGGDCFFDSMAKVLGQIRPETKFSVKSLRADCAKYVKEKAKSREGLPDWIRKSFGQPRDNNGQTISTVGEYQDIQHSVGEFPRKKIPRPIWGLPEVEGRILCEIYGVELHLIEKYAIKGQDIYVDTFINKSSNSQSPDKANKKNTIHIINQGTSHFEPLFEKRPGAYGDYLTIRGLSDDINPASGTTSQNATSNQANSTAQPSSTIPRSAILDMTEEELDAALADVEHTKFKTDHQNQFKKAYSGKGCQSPYKPQKQKGNGGALARFVEGIVGHLLHNKSLAKASHKQKNYNYEATRGGAQYKPQGRSVTGEYVHPTSPVLSKADRKSTALWHDKPEAPKPVANQPKHSQLNVGRPQAPKPNAKPPKSFLRGLSMFSITRPLKDARNKGRGFINVPKRQG